VIKIVRRQGDGEIGRSGKQKSVDQRRTHLRAGMQHSSTHSRNRDMGTIRRFRNTIELNFLTRKVEV
jgi:hypothetical protein